MQQNVSDHIQIQIGLGKQKTVYYRYFKDKQGKTFYYKNKKKIYVKDTKKLVSKKVKK